MKNGASATVPKKSSTVPKSKNLVNSAENFFFVQQCRKIKKHFGKLVLYLLILINNT